ncbi:MAG TPA: CarD family transcriptional regulator [Blastocatellia bacterium]|nr:CarD family transcriptional regulator [Blastocatellia bacterium]
MVFKVGQKVVYPTQGIAIVEQIESRQIDGGRQEFYLLRLHANQSLVMVPMRNADEIGLRRPIAARQCEELMQVLAKDFSTPPADWKDRFKEFTEVMRSGDLFGVAEVLKTLTYLNQLKPLSFREKQMLERARYLIVSELALVSRRSEASIMPKVEEALSGACTKHAKSVATAH